MAYKYLWKDMPKSEDGIELQYAFREEEPPQNYTVEYLESTVVEVDGEKLEFGHLDSTIINTYKIDKSGTFKVIKRWENGPKEDHKPENIQLSLWRTTNIEPKKYEKVSTTTAVQSAEKTLDRDSVTEYTYQWTGLEKTDLYGNEYTYFFTEEIHSNLKANYTAEYDSFKTITIDNKVLMLGEDVSKVTNAYQIPNTGEFTSKKIWVDGP